MAQGLDFSPLDRRAQIYHDKARRDEMTQQAVEQTAKGIFDIVDWQKNMRQKFDEASEFDYDITLDAQANSYLANRYDKALRQPHIEAVMGKRWKNQDHVNKMLATQKQLEREAVNVKGMVQARQKAQDLVNKNPLTYKMNGQAISDFENFLMGKTDVKNGNAFMMGLQGTDGVPPFLDIKEHDVDAAIDPIAMGLRDKYATIRNEVVNEVNKTDLTTSQKYKAVEAEAQEIFGNLVWGELQKSKNFSQTAMGLGKNVASKLSEEGIAATTPMEDLEGYVFDKDYSEYFGERLVEEKTVEKPVKEDTGKTDGGGGSPSQIKKTDIGWKFGTTPVAITTETEDGVTDAKVYEIVEKDGGYIAKLKVPTLNGEEIKDLMSLTEENLGRKPTQEEFLNIMIKKRSKTIEKPLDDIYDELDVAFKRYPKGGLSLEGWADIKKKVEKDEESSYVGVPKGGF